MDSPNEGGAPPQISGERDLEKGFRAEHFWPSPSPSPRAPALVVSNSSKALIVSNSGKRFDQSGKKKYVRQVTGRYNDTELHLAAQKGDVAAVTEILGEIDEQMLKTLRVAEFDAGVAEIREAVVNEVNELGETALYIAAEKGFIDVMKELLPYSTREGIRMKNRSGFDPLHIAASRGHHDIVQLLLDHDPELTRQGHADIVKALLEMDRHLARKTDKKGQTALHMAVKGVSSAVVRLLLQADPAIVMLPDKFGNIALHIATRKKRAEIVIELLRLRDTNVNALTRDQKTTI
ncbi:ankyrin repeat-containing protein ITN1-like [Salvia divinorum]|uniref:Ankyrin repeat-containing protein ITN1-like n=1 Tax=Salvia divinorum TaxID=28513 RepID=A0ABD1IB51_SALDI